MSKISRYAGIATLLWVWALAPECSAVDVGNNYTRYDNWSSDTDPWYEYKLMDTDDDEVEPGNPTGQEYDLEGIFKKGQYFDQVISIVTGFDIANPEEGNAIGDIFFSNYPAYGDGLPPFPWDEYNNFYSYVLSIDWDGSDLASGSIRFKIYELPSNPATISVSIAENSPNSDPWRYDPATGLSPIGIIYGTYLPQVSIDDYDLSPDTASHYVIQIDYNLLLYLFDEFDWISGIPYIHITTQSGGDNLMGDLRNSGAPPVGSEPGPDQVGKRIGETIQLDGSSSLSPDGEVEFFWTFESVPDGSAASITNPASVYPTFVPDMPGEYEIELTIDHFYYGDNSDTVLITVDNRDPIASADSVTVNEDTAPSELNVLANDSNAGDTGDTHTITNVGTCSAGGTATNNGGTGILYAPAANYHGVETFSYTISDEHGGTAQATVTVTVNSVNDPPTANNDSYTFDEDSETRSLGVLANDTFAPDTGETLTITGVGTPSAGGTANNSGGTHLRYTPAADFFGQETFTYTISDGNGGTAQAMVTVTLNSVNDPPSAVNDAFSVGEDSGTTNLYVLANDSTTPDTGEMLTITGLGARSAGGAATIIGGTSISYAPAANYFGQETFTYSISDGNGGTAQATVTITVNNVNDPPTAVADAYTVIEDGNSYPLSVMSNDSFAPDSGELLSIVSVGTPSAGGAAVNPIGPHIFYSPASNFFGQETFTYTISDGNGGTAQALVTVTVNNANDPPTAVNDLFFVDEDSGFQSIDVLANDTFAPDTGETLTVTGVGTPSAGGTAISSGGSHLSYAPASDFFGQESFTYTISDGNDGTAQATVTVTVNGVNDPPAAYAGSSLTKTLGAVVTLDGSGSHDPENTELTYDWLLEPPPGSSAVLSNPALAAPTLIPDKPGPYLLTLRVHDGVVWSPPDYATINVPPSVGVSNLLTSNSRPEIRGTTNDPHAAIEVQVGGGTYAALNNLDGTWSLPQDSIAPLDTGTYDVVVTATHGEGNSATDATVNELQVLSAMAAIWVDFTWPHAEHGTFAAPFSGISTAKSHVSPGGVMRIKGAASTGETVTLSNAMRIEAEGGAVQIGVGVVKKRIDGSLTLDSPVDAPAFLARLKAALTIPSDSSAYGVESEDFAATTGEIFEAVMPTSRTETGTIDASPLSVLALRLRADAAIAPDSLSVNLRAEMQEQASVEWMPMDGESLHDIWVLVRPLTPWQPGNRILVDAAAIDEKGTWVETDLYTFQIKSASPPVESLWQSGLGVEDDASTTSYEASDIAIVSEADATLVIGPERVFETPQRVWLPLPAGVEIGEASLEYYHPHGEAPGWYPANIVKGWLLPESQCYLEAGGTTYLGIVVRHAATLRFAIE